MRPDATGSALRAIFGSASSSAGYLDSPDGVDFLPAAAIAADSRLRTLLDVPKQP